MDYEKEYKEARERAKKLQENSNGMILKKWLWAIFPELQESEDEQHRKWILECLYDGLRRSDEQFKDQFKSAIAWLEKQGEQKPANSYCQKNCKGYQETGKCFADGDCEAKREAESIDKAEPKFKTGDWITDGNINIQIEAIKNDRYLYYGSCALYNIKIAVADKIYHLWTLDDAKDGDVLTSLGFHTNCTFIFKGLDNWKFDEPNGDRAVATGYCCLSVSADKMEFGIQGPDCIEVNTVKPATKIQRDLLFQKMKEAGYEWDSEKKEPKKIDEDGVEYKKHKKQWY